MEGLDKENAGLENCCICFYPLVTEICQLDCKHLYHFTCLTEWQQNKKTLNIICPICQQNTVVNTIFDLPLNETTSPIKSNDLNNNTQQILNTHTHTQHTVITGNNLSQTSDIYPVLTYTYGGHNHTVPRTIAVERNRISHSQNQYHIQPIESRDKCLCCTII